MSKSVYMSAFELIKCAKQTLKKIEKQKQMYSRVLAYVL